MSTKHNRHVHVCLQEQSGVFKHNRHVHVSYRNTQNTTIMSMVCLQEQSSAYKTQQTCPWCVYRNSPVSTKHNKHVHGVFTGTVQCLQNTTDMSMVCLQEQSSVYKTQQTCPWCVYRNSPVSTKHNRHVHGVFTGTCPVSTKHNRNMSMVCLQEQSSVYKTQQTCPWCVYRNSPVSTKHNRHVHGVFTGTVQCLQNTTKVSMTCLQGQSSVYKLQQTSSRRVYRDSPTI